MHSLFNASRTPGSLAPPARLSRGWSRPVRHRLRLAVCSCGLAVGAWFAGPRAAADEPTPRPNQLILLGGGGDLRQSDKSSFGALQIRFATDYRGVRPYATAGWASDGSYYSGAGLYYQFALPHELQITIGSGPGFYRHRGRTTNLGYALEFNSWIELSGMLLGRRVGLSYGHISNAHLGRVNPGTETLGFSVSVLSW